VDLIQHQFIFSNTFCLKGVIFIGDSTLTRDEVNS